MNDGRYLEHRMGRVMDEIAVVSNRRQVDAIGAEIDHMIQVGIQTLQAHVSVVKVPIPATIAVVFAKEKLDKGQQI